MANSCGAIVVGAGPAGLATAAALQARGLGAIILEKGDAVAPLRPPASSHGPRALRPAGPPDAEGLRPLSLPRSSRPISRGLRGKVRP